MVAPPRGRLAPGGLTASGGLTTSGGLTAPGGFSGGRRVSAAKDAILAAVRDALGPSPAVPDVPRAYRPAGTLAPDVDLFAERVAEYRATVHRVTRAELAAKLAELARGRTGIPPGFPFEGGVEDRDLSVAELDALDSVVTGCALAIADTGTIVLDGGPRCGRRALTLVPDHHVCVVDSDQVVASVPDAIARLDASRPITLVSGPSATSDIELDRVEGVHGPRDLDVVIVAP
jgi:L-lactate dehydrogenase complex protein LldG